MLAPVLIVFVAALLGVLVEAFVPRDVRRVCPLVCSVASRTAGFVVLTEVSAPDAGKVVAQNTISIDKPTVFLQGTILLLSLMAFLLSAERKVDTLGDPFAPAGSSIPASEFERELD